MHRLPRAARQLILSRLIAIGVVVAMASLFIGIAQAQQSGQGRPAGAPPEALEACSGKVVGDACQMTIRGKEDTVSGQCIETPDKKVACLPEGAPRPPKS
ncbi:hypothetical protein [Aliiruegeria sabulilitoris]|uniref:hypothetical protein n=1 Tax=Aliiruegeria sabulilitoris TaxID=1510458 RepID=UPI0008303F24|nr:hypothetical protein [Aliiruegeria sabulilitoris]NDR58918.1 hypothetical protein [Pseudoruegeria sp. M32A2M]